MVSKSFYGQPDFGAPYVVKPARRWVFTPYGPRLITATGVPEVKPAGFALHPQVGGGGGGGGGNGAPRNRGMGTFLAIGGLLLLGALIAK
jgi:hypothetical protein